MKKYLLEVFIGFLFITFLASLIYNIFIISDVMPPLPQNPNQTETKKETIIVVGTLLRVEKVNVICINGTKEIKYRLTLREINKKGKIVVSQYFTNFLSFSFDAMVGQTVAIEPLDRSVLCGKK